MSHSPEQPATSSHADDDVGLSHIAETNIPARTDLYGASGWFALGLAILIGSIMMDRLEAQHINPNTVPGLLPGLLGIGMMILGALLAIRSLQRGALHELPRIDPLARKRLQRLVLVMLLCVGYGFVVGHGIPFWLTCTVFVMVSILVLDHLQKPPGERRPSLREIVIAALIGLGTGACITLVFEFFFLVRLP